MVLIPTLNRFFMSKNKILLVTARYGSLKFSETACPYNENAHDEQVDDCVESIRKKIADSGKAEMTDVFQFYGKLF
jgi:hypothetical protein